MNHLLHCKFEKNIKELESWSWSSGIEEISGSVDISKERIVFSDGWSTYPALEFKFCPECGVKLRS